MKEDLASLEVAFRFLAGVFHAPPTPAFINRLAGEELIPRWPLGSAWEETRIGIGMMETFCAAWNESMLPELEDDFTRLFVGPGCPLAPPWESYYVSRDHLLFQEQTLAVRQAYRHSGFEVSQRGCEPEDSLSLELSFLAELCGRCSDTSYDGSQGVKSDVTEALRQFLASHVLQWVPRCLRLVIEGARLDYYRAAASLGLGALRGAAGLLGFERGFSFCARPGEPGTEQRDF